MSEFESDNLERVPSLSKTPTRVGDHLENYCGVGSLTTRQREIMELVVAGHPSKNIAADLRISQRTVENHRAAIMKKTGSKSIPALVRLYFGVIVDGDAVEMSMAARAFSA